MSLEPHQSLSNRVAASRLVEEMIRTMSWHVMFAPLLMVLSGLTEGVGLLLLLPLMQVAGLNVQHGSTGRLAEVVSSGFALFGVHPGLIQILAVFLFVNMAQALLSRWQSIYNTGLIYKFTSRLAQRLYRAIAQTSWLFFSRTRASDFTHALTSEINRTGAAARDLLTLTAIATITVVYLLLALRLSAVLSALVLGCGGVLLLVLRGSMRAARRHGEALSSATREVYAAAVEHLSGMKTVKSYGAEERNAGVFARLTDQVSAVYIGFVRSQQGVTCWFRIGSVFTLSIILYVSLTALAFPTAGLLLLLFLFSRLMPQFSSLQQNYQQLVNDLPAFARVADIQARCEAAAEPTIAEVEQVELRQGIRCSQVSFTYVPGAPDVISRLDLFIRAGATTAIVGPSGVGKSTVADLVMGLITPNQGRVMVDERPLSPTRLQSWRNQIGYVTQDTFLFHDTIRANLLWACPGASDDELKQALRMAAAEEFVTGLPLGLETVAGDRGVCLSGGERQRLALARALLRRPALLILDEATSALDSENEQRIQRAIDNLRGNLTILIITHRLSTIREADVIYVLEYGATVEAGAWGELVAKEGGRFQALYKTQMSETLESFILPAS